MKKLCLLNIIFLSLLSFGCGGGGSSVATDDNEVENENDTGFEYPSVFNDYSTFKGISESNNVITSLPIATADKVALSSALGGAVLTSLGITGLLTIIDEFPSISRASSCEIGDLNVIGYSSSPDTGSFKTSNFSGVSTQANNSSPNCNNLYYDGAISYSFDDQIVSINYGIPSSQLGRPFGEPFFVGSNGNFNASNAFLGSIISNRPNEESDIYTIDDSLELYTVFTNVTIDDYAKTSDFEQFNWRLFKSLEFSSIKNGNQSILNANYERRWREYGETFILFSKIENIVTDSSGTIISGNASYNLIVEGDTSGGRFVTASVIYGPDIKITYNKEGVIQKNF